jgi:hypothetical protein
MIGCKFGDFFIGRHEHLARDNYDFINLVCVHERDARASMGTRFIF